MISSKTQRQKAPSAAAIKKAELRLEAHCLETRQRLTPMRREVFRFLQSQVKPQTAYQVLDGVRQSLGKKVAPLSVYRALDFLAAEGWLHRLESLRAFTPCSDPHHHHTGVLFLCSDCGCAEEAEDEQLEALIERDAKQRGFRARHRIVEVLGQCRDCRA